MTTVTLPPIGEDTAREAARMSRTWREVPAISDAVARHYLDGFRWLDVNDHATLTALDAVRGVPDDQPTTVTTEDVRAVLDVIRANDARLSTWGREAASALLSWVVAHEAAPSVGDRIRRRVPSAAAGMTGTVTGVNVQTNTINWTDDAGQDWSGSITNDGHGLNWWERVTPFDGPRNPMPSLRQPRAVPPIIVVDGDDLDTLKYYAECTDPGSVRVVRLAIINGQAQVATNGGEWSRPLGRPANDRGW